MPDPKTSRGYRNKNPGNIDWNERNKWQGQIGKEPGANSRFAVFESHEYGIRALAMLLTTYQDRYGLRTVRALINRWAPPNENSTDAYVSGVARMVGIDPDTERVDLHTYAHLRPMVAAIITHELGGQPYPDAVIDEGLRRAGVVRPVETIRQAAKTSTGAASINVATLTGAAGVAAPILTSLGGWPWQATVALVVAAAIGVVAWTLSQRKTA